MTGQITQWIGEDVRSSWFQGLVTDGPQALREELDAAAAKATGAYAALRDWLRGTYGPAVVDSPDIAGDERYARWVRYWNGMDPDLEEAYLYGWSEFYRLRAEMASQAADILPGAPLGRHGVSPTMDTRSTVWNGCATGKQLLGSARPGHRLQTGRAGLAGRQGRGPHRARRRLRPR